MWPDRVSNPGPLTYESSALWTALRSPAILTWKPVKWAKANSADPYQTPHNAPSDQGLHCLIIDFSIKNR